MASTPDQWQKIETLYHAALERDPAVRAAFLDGACEDDAELRREVESLLAEASKTQGLLDLPVGALLAGAGTIELTAGTRLGPYQIEGLIGEGGMGRVYRARDTRLGRTVAIKVSSARFSERFEREARAVASLNHPHICHLFDVGQDYLVMEYIEGTPLKGPLPVDQALKYGEQICDALEAAHSAGIVHRDLKPGNILVSKQGIKLLDFGVARMASGPDDETLTQMTQAGAVIGTPAYLAPEQWEGKHADARSDIYSFGCVLHEMLTGKRVAPDRAAAIQLSTKVQPELGRILSKCLETDPDLRYQHAEEIRTDLVRLQRDTESVRVASGASPRASTHWRAALSFTAAGIAVVVTGYFYFSQALHGMPKLTDKDTIVLADFTNTTGDPVFDETLRQGVAVQLEQSPFLSLISDERIQRTIGLMGQPADVRLTPKIAQEICERTASAAVLEGSIASLGSQYVVGLRAKSCRTRDVLDEEQVQAARKEDVLTALSQIAGRFRTRVGESLAMIEKHSTPLAEATTSSLDALKAYSHGLKLVSSSGDAVATPYFRRATEIDSQFAMAHARLGLGYGSVGELTRSIESFRRARQLRNRASDAEKFFIDAIYDLQVTGNLERAEQTCEEWEQAYPREANGLGFLGAMIYPDLGKYEKALESARKLVAIDPDFAIGYLQVAFNNTFLGRVEESDRVLRQAAERKMEIPEFFEQRYDNAFLRGDRAAMDREVALSRGKPNSEDWLSDQEAFVLAYSGHLKQAREKSGHAADLAKQASRPERAAQFENGTALWEAFFGDWAAAKQRALAILGLSRARDVEYGAALALSLSGELSEARKLASDLEARFPEDTAVKFSYLPALRALSVLTTQPGKAVDILEIAIPYELGTPPSSAFAFFGNLYPVYVRGEAYLAAHRGTEAAAEFQKIIDHRNIVISDPIGALAHLQLGRALVLAGDKAKAKTAYQDFLTLWKDADPDIPIFRQAKAEYAGLR